MGALHEGHLSLIRRSRQENDWVVVSIFVNPLQFSPNEDFQRYPRPLDADRHLCEQAGVDVLFIPTVTELYGTTDPRSSLGQTQVLPPAEMMAGLCGQTRTGHFPGVATVVMKLLNIVQPDRAYFGQKDAQQVAILRRMMADLNVPVELWVCPTAREADGLALSSRNQYLSPSERSEAAVLYRSLQQAHQLFHQGCRSSHELIAEVKAELEINAMVQPEYVELVHPDTLVPIEQVEDSGLLAIAARIGSTRLIDNLLLHNRQPIVAIDGPAGAGKSTVVRQVAQELGLLYLDTGAMYRAVTWLVLQSGIAIDDEAAIAELVSQCDICFGGHPSNFTIYINGHDVTHAIRGVDVTSQVSQIAAQPFVRQALVKQQQRFGRRGGVVMDGRDIGTHVFPDAELKIFLTASVQERARRRQQDLKNQGQPELTLEELEQSISERDRKDSTRDVSPLRKAEDAIELVTDQLSIDQVTAKIVNLYYQRLAALSSSSSS
jgi:pantoate ligase/cytidylate kinase